MHDRAARKLDLGLLLIGGLFLLALPLLFKPWIHGADTIGYYSWLRSFVIDGDLQTADEFTHFGMEWLNTFAETGLRTNPSAVGSALLWLPGFLLAHGVTLLGDSFGLALVADGYSPLYVWAAALASALYALTGLFLTYQIAKTIFYRSVAALAVVVVWFASPLVFYMFSHPLMSHANDAFAYALFLFIWFHTRHDRSAMQYALLGLAAGLCALVRTQNAALVLFPLVEIGVDTVRRAQKSGWADAFTGGLLKAVAFSATWWLVFVPQVGVWRTVFGSWLPGNPYAESGGGAFDLARPHLAGVLFSTNRGLFLWTPVLLFGVLGWAFLWRRQRRFAALMITNFALQLYVIASWSSWGGSAAFGQRFFTNMTPAFAIGLAALLAVLARRVSIRWLTVAGALFAIWNGLLMLRYVVGDVPRYGPVPIDQLLMGQFTVVPHYFERIIEILITRG